MSAGTATLALGLLAWISVAAGAALTAAWRRRALPAGARTGPAVEVALLRPCAGAEPGLEARLASGLRGTTRHRLQHLLLVGDARDGALPAARAAAAVLRAAGAPADCLVVPPPGPNRKAGQLQGGLDALRARGRVEVVLAVDSDVDLSGVDLDALIDPLLAEPRLGATWAPPVERGPLTTRGDRVSRAVLLGSLHAFPLLAGIDPQGLVGKAFALRLSDLEAMGGFAAVQDRLGEDMALAGALRTRGLAVRAVAITVPSLAQGRTVEDTLARLSRWVQVIRAQRPGRLWAWPGLFAPLPGQLALAGLLALLPGGAAPAFALAGLALAVRLGTAALARRACGAPLRPGDLVLDVLLGEPTLLLAWARALYSPAFTWRGTALRIGPGGRLLSDDRATSPRGAPGRAP